MFGFNLWDFLLYSLPWWLQVILLAIPVVALFWLATGIFGWNRVKGWIIPALVAIGAAGVLSRQRQQGYTDRKTQEQDALKKAEVIVEKKKSEVKAMPDDKLNDAVDRWSRK